MQKIWCACFFTLKDTLIFHNKLIFETIFFSNPLCKKMSIFWQNWVNFKGVFVKSQLGNKSTFNLLIISQPKNIGKKSTFNLLVLSQPKYIELTLQVNRFICVGKKSTMYYQIHNWIVWSPSSPCYQCLLYRLAFVLNLWDNL